MRRNSIAFAYFVLVAVWMTFPLITQLNSAFPGAPESDAYEYARHIWWMSEAITNGQNPYVHPTLAHPNGLPAAWLWAIPLQSFPAWLYALILPLPIAYNVMTLTRLALNGWAVYYLMRRLLDGTHPHTPPTPHPDLPAVLAGTIFALAPVVQGQMFGSHVGIVALWGAPLLVDRLLCMRQQARPADYLLAGVWFTVSLLGSNLLLIVLLFPVVLLFVLARVAAREWGWLRRTLIALFVGIICSAAFIVPAVIEQLTSPAAVDPGGGVRFSADLLAFASPSFFHPLYANLSYPPRVLGTNIVEGSGYIGLIAGLLALIGVVRTRGSRWWLLLALLAWVLSLGPLLKLFDQPVSIVIDSQATYVPMPFALLAKLPILDQTRTPARFNLTVALSVAIMAGYGGAWISQRLKRGHRIATGLLIVLVALDSHAFWHGFRPAFPTLPAHIPPEIHAIAADDAIRAVLNLPHDNLLVAKEAMYLQTAHQKPLIAGFISRQTPVSPAKLSVLQTTLDPALLDAAEADIVIVFHEWDRALNERAAAAFGAALYTNERIAVYRVPPSTTPPTFRAASGEPSVMITDHADWHVYTPTPTWIALNAIARTSADRTVVMQIDGVPLHTSTVADGDRVRWAGFLAGGYHTLTVALDPPCPAATPHPRLACHTITLNAVAISAPLSPTLNRPVTLGNAVTLESAVILSDDTADEIVVGLQWAADTAISDNMVRFVHLLNEEGQQIAGDDLPLGELYAGERRVEQVVIAIPADEHVGAVYTGLYTYPDLTRLDVPGTSPDALADWVRLR